MLRNVLYLVVAGAFSATLAGPASAEFDTGYLYGRVITVDGTTYQGEIRWGREETFWDDMFNTTKIENPNIDYLDDDELESIERKDRSWWDDTFSWGRDDEHTHRFAVRFGDVRAIEMDGDEVEIEFNNGMKMAFEGGSNDIGASIIVLDAETGRVKLKWDRVKRVEFMNTPNRLEVKLGDPLYGTVETRHGSFTGLVQWDHEECLTSDVLDGDTRDGDMSISFGNIESIEKKGKNRSLVTLRSGRKLELRGSNDVNHDNRGIVVKDPDFGKVKVMWNDFEKVTFETKSRTSGDSYGSYGSPRELIGSVRTSDGDTFSGRIVFDLDEEWDFEILDGSRGDTEYMIPFRSVARIIPENRNSTTVELKSGKTVRLENSQDVTRHNDGILVFALSREDDPVYIRWKDVEEITFN
ncbi:MAG: hypothetical protein O7D32_09765 [bacterium]|nr:hypothetical protein [bacterium]